MDKSALNTRINVDILDHIYQKFHKVIIADSCGAVVFIMVLWSAVDHRILLIWLTLELLINGLARHILTFTYFYYKKRQQIQNNIVLWRNLFILSLFVSGLFWSSAGCLYMFTADPGYRLIIMLYMTGIIGAAIPSLLPSKLSCIAFVTPVAISMFLISLSFDNFLSIVLVITVLIYIISSVNSAFIGCDTIINSFKLHHTNLKLAHDLSDTNKRLQQSIVSLSENERVLRLIQENAPIGMAIVSLTGKLLIVNKALCEIVGYSKAELQRFTFQEITLPNDRDEDLDFVNKLMEGDLSSYQYEKRYIHKNRYTVWVLLSVTLIRDVDNKPLYFISQIENIDERKRDEIFQSKLKKMNLMLQICHSSTEAYNITSKFAREIFDDFDGGLAILDAQSDILETVNSWSNIHRLKNRFSKEDCLSLRSFTLFVANKPNDGIICNHFDVIPTGGYICIPLISDGHIMGLINFISPTNEAISGYNIKNMLTFSEIIKLSIANIKLHELMQEQAIHDALTGLFNRHYLIKTLPNQIERGIRENKTLCVSLLDLDFFKKINDTWGHIVGDEVLKYIGDLLKSNFKGKDICCRFGGEEFIVILIDTTLANAVNQLEKIRVEVENAKLFFNGATLPRITISIGIAEIPTHAITIEEVIAQADHALYEAKASGRNRLKVAKSKELTPS